MCVEWTPLTHLIWPGKKSVETGIVDATAKTESTLFSWAEFFTDQPRPGTGPTDLRSVVRAYPSFFCQSSRRPLDLACQCKKN